MDRGVPPLARRTLSRFDDMSALDDVIDFITQLKKAQPALDKSGVQTAFVQRFKPQKVRSLFLGDGYAIRFSEAAGAAFSNTVLGLHALQAVDDRPVVVCILRPATVEFVLANSTLLKKVSHSSIKLRVNNVRGSFNGTDILIDYDGLTNRPENFERLFAMHSAYEWAENLERLVEATNAIVGHDRRFRPTDVQRQTILTAPGRFVEALRSSEFQGVEKELRQMVDDRRVSILQAAAAASTNVNRRGNRIEQIVTGGANAHDLGDLVRDLADGRLVVDVKSKLLGGESAPKAYNVDKALSFLAEPGSVFAFFILRVDLQASVVAGRLVPVLEDVLRKATVVQHHWAGRASRGVTQLTGAFDRVLAPDFAIQIDVTEARVFLDRLLGLLKE